MLIPRRLAANIIAGALYRQAHRLRSESPGHRARQVGRRAIAPQAREERRAEIAESLLCQADAIGSMAADERWTRGPDIDPAIVAWIAAYGLGSHDSRKAIEAAVGISPIGRMDEIPAVLRRVAPHQSEIP